MSQRLSILVAAAITAIVIAFAMIASGKDPKKPATTSIREYCQNEPILAGDHFWYIDKTCPQSAKLVEIAREVQKLSPSDREKLRDRLLELAKSETIQRVEKFPLPNLLNRTFDVINFDKLMKLSQEPGSNPFVRYKVYLKKLEETLCRGSDPDLPSPSFYPDVVTKVTFTTNYLWPIEILAAMSRCEDDWASDGYHKNGTLGISGALMAIHLEKQFDRQNSKAREGPIPSEK